MTAMSKKGRRVFQEKNRGVTPSVAAPGVTHPSDATDSYVANNVCILLRMLFSFFLFLLYLHILVEYFTRYLSRGTSTIDLTL